MTGKKGLRSAIGVMGLVVALAALTLTVVWAQESDTVGSDGGTLSFDDGNVMVRVPQGATPGDITISYAAMTADEAPAPAPEDTRFGSRIFSLSADPDDDLKQLAEITVSYTMDDIDAAGGRADNVGLYIYDPAFNAWNRNDAAVRDVVNNTLSSNQTDLSVTMAIIAAPPGGIPPREWSSDDGSVMIMFPAGSAYYDIEVEHTAADAPADAPEGTAFGSSIFTLGPDQDLDEAAHVTVSYTADDVAAAGDDAAMVNLYMYDADSEMWAMAEAERNMEDMTLTTSVMNLAGTMAIINTLPEMPTTGGVAPGTGLLAGIAVLGALLALGGGYLYIRGRQAGAA